MRGRNVEVDQFRYQIADYEGCPRVVTGRNIKVFLYEIYMDYIEYPCQYINEWSH